MKRKSNILSHLELSQVPVLGKSSNLEHLSVFRVDFKNQENTALSFLKESFRSDFFSVIQVISGSMSTKVDFKTVDVYTNELFIMSPASIKQLVSISSDCTIEGISFTSDLIKEIKLNETFIGLMEFFLSKYMPIWQLSKNHSKLFSQQIRELEKRIAKRFIHSYGMEILVNSFIIFLYEIAEISKTNSVPVGPVFGRKEELVIKFSRLALQHHISERRLVFYSKQLFVSIKYLSESVKEITGKTAGQILDDLQIQEAKRLLEETGLGISEIAYRLQFTNPAFFSKFFSRLQGLSPRAYRASLSKSSSDTLG